MVERLDEYLTPALMALLVGVLVPIFSLWYRHRSTVVDVYEGLSKNEAQFRADVLLRANYLAEQNERLMKRNADFEVEITKLKVQVAQLHAELALHKPAS